MVAEYSAEAPVLTLFDAIVLLIIVAAIPLLLWIGGAR
jgi:hypothetical protein